MWFAITSVFLHFLLSLAYLVDDAQQNTLERVLEDNKIVLAAFTSNDLDSLTPFRNVFKHAAEDSQIPFLHIDCAQERNLCEEQDVHTYPAIRLYKKNNSEDATNVEMRRYRGPKTVNALKSFVKKHEHPILTQLDRTTYAKFKDIDKVVIIAYLSREGKELELIRSIASQYWEAFIFGYVIDERVAEAEGLTVPAVVSYKNTDGDNRAISGELNEEKLEMFLELASKNVIGDFNERSMNDYMAKDKLAVYIFAASETEANSVRRELTPLAKKYEKYVKFGVADAVEYRPMARSLGLAEDRFPALAVHAPLNDNTFSYRQGRIIMSSAVERMLTVILQGKAASGQVFGEEAPRFDENDGGAVDGQKHDEL